mgnify:FL=1
MTSHMNQPPDKPSRFSAVRATPFGALGVWVESDVIAELVFLPRGTQAVSPKAGVACEACRQIDAFVRDPDFVFDLPLKLVGTPFQRRVWDAIAAIPRGRTRQYGELARELGAAPRAVGQACGANFFPLVIPCHRVVAASGLGGFARHERGYYLGVKRWLLAHEDGAPESGRLI